MKRTESERKNGPRPTQPERRDGEAAGSSARRAPVAGLQRAVGNQAVLQLHEDGDPPAERTGARNADGAAADAGVHDVVHSPGEALPADVERDMGARFGRDLSDVRIHAGREAAASARRLNARAYTVGRDVVFGDGEYEPRREAGRRLLAHELTHVLQQGGRRPPYGRGLGIAESGEATARRNAARFDAGGALATPTSKPLALMRDVDDPSRFETVHENVFEEAPGVGEGTRRPWTDEAARRVEQQFRDTLQALVDDNPRRVMGEVRTRTTEQAAEEDAKQADQRIQNRFPYLPESLSEGRIQEAVTVRSAGTSPGEEFVKQWLWNRLIKWTDVEEYDVDEGDPAQDRFLTELVRDQDPFDFTEALATLRSIVRNQVSDRRTQRLILARERARVRDKSWGWVVETLAGRVGAFEEGGTVTFSPGVGAASRRLTLIHELVHFYEHPGFREWIEQAPTPSYYTEGFAEYLARQVMSEEERSGRTSYQDRFEAVDQEVAVHVPPDDIARAFFLGEVWRIEGTTTVARERFAEATGIESTATRAEEREASRTGAGIVQTVRRGERYRFMNLGVGSAEPKPEHRDGLERIVSEIGLEGSSARLRFVGHASSPGSAGVNRRLARRRARAFYDLARELGVPEDRLVDADSPPAEGERTPTAAGDSPFGRALNRRVELFVLTDG